MQKNVQKEIGGHKWRHKKKPRFDEELDLSIGKNPLNKYIDEKDVQDVTNVQTVIGSEDNQTQTWENEVDKTEFG